MIRIDHIDILQVGGGGLIGQVHRVVQREVPDREGLKLGVARLDAPAVLMVELGQAGGHLAAAGARGGDHHKRPAGDDVVVAAVALIADDQRDIGRVAGDGIVEEHRHPEGLQPVAKGIGGGLALVLGDDHAAHIQPDGPEGIDQAQHLLVVGDAQVAPDLVFLQVTGVHRDDDLRLVLELEQHTHLAVRRKARQHPGGVEVIEELAAKLEVELAAKRRDALPDVLRLHGEILLVVKSDFHNESLPFLTDTRPVSAKRDACGRL